MQKTLTILISTLALATLTGCFKNYGPDETMAMMGEPLRLPPDYGIASPSNVKTIRTTQQNADVQSQRILLGKIKKVPDYRDVNTWLIKNAGGERRVKNIKKIVSQDLEQENKKD